MEQLNFFFKLRAAGPSKMFPGHLLHAVQCTASDLSQNALRLLTKQQHTNCPGGIS